ncbi:hypothetical protein PoB_005769400 [Plakobranchus ocellatus]|uniref:Uncharacterized protein n=1 Tax=Plakobranchus ocellatus TaxID=259542 RepID=A0AAV4CEX4_9GAST|nr:hypothetical protein PoB_005769400 [Plakobranchus ocellatus]
MKLMRLARRVLCQRQQSSFPARLESVTQIPCPLPDVGQCCCPCGCRAVRCGAGPCDAVRCGAVRGRTCALSSRCYHRSDQRLILEVALGGASRARLACLLWPSRRAIDWTWLSIPPCHV